MSTNPGEQTAMQSTGEEKKAIIRDPVDAILEFMRRSEGGVVVNVGKNWHDLGYSGPRTCAQRLRQLAVDYELPFRLINTNPRPSADASTARICPPISAERTTMAPGSLKKGNDENKPLVSAPASANASAAAIANLSTAGNTKEKDDEPKEKAPEKPKITRYQKKRRREFKVIKHNRPHFTDEQAWIVVGMVDGSASLQGQNEADKQVLTSETDSDWDDDKMQKARGLRRQ